VQSGNDLKEQHRWHPPSYVLVGGESAPLAHGDDVLEVNLNRSKRDIVLATLMQRSTMLGIVGAVVSVLSVMGVDVDPEQRTQILEVSLLVVSIVAIVVQPKSVKEIKNDRGYSGDDSFGT
jgi:hypothetical protein